MKALELARILGGKLIGNRKATAESFSIDSRTIKKGQVFVALKGSKNDGHDFVEDAFLKGASGAIVEKELPFPGRDKFLIKVNSCLEALRTIGRHRRERFRGEIIGVAGSAGKTTTKELVAFLLSKVGRVYRSEGNLNSRIGLPLVLSNMDESAEFGVFELGASALGDVLELTRLIKPRIRVITALGEEHLESFGSLENVIKGNGEIFWNFGAGDWAVIPSYANKYFELPKDRTITFGKGGKLEARNVSLSLEGTLFEINHLTVAVPVLSTGIVENVLASFGVLTALGYNLDEFAPLLKKFQPPRGRMNLVDLGEFYVIDDTYNANPLSVRNALITLASLETPGEKVVLLGDMLELGRESGKLHAQVGKLVAELGINTALFYGKEMKKAYSECRKRGGNCVLLQDAESVLEALLQKACCKNIILVKGSRGMKMEIFVNKLVEFYWNGFR